MLRGGILALACALCPVAQPAPLNLVFAGDSLTEGVPHFGGEGETMPFQVSANFLGSDYARLAYRGQTSDFLLRQVSTLFPLSKDGYTNILVLWVGSNDCAIGPIDCAPSVYRNLVAIAIAAHAGGWQVIAVTLIGRDNYFIDDAHRAQFPSNQAAINSLLLSSEAFDAVADASAILNDPADAAYFWDRCHLLPRGYAVVAGKVVEAVKGLLSEGARRLPVDRRAL